MQIWILTVRETKDGEFLNAEEMIVYMDDDFSIDADDSFEKFFDALHESYPEFFADDCQYEISNWYQPAYDIAVNDMAKGKNPVDFIYNVAHRFEKEDILIILKETLNTIHAEFEGVKEQELLKKIAANIKEYN